MDGPEKDDEVIEGEQILSEGLIVEEAEQRIIAPKSGKLFAEDGTVRISVIRPCVSRGRRLRGLPPIYTPQMLAENASVFSGWLMYADHLSEGIVKALQERGRSIRELGGRITGSHFDPELTFKDDDEYGYRKGGVIGKALPQPFIRNMLEADPEILHCSINAYPKGVKQGTAPWNSTVKGMLVEGIRSKPPGSVDWVPRGGAGGRVLQEDVEAQIIGLIESFFTDATTPAVSLSGTSYDPAHATGGEMKKISEMSREELVAHIKAENPSLAGELKLGETETPPTPTPTPTPTPDPTLSGALTEADLDARLAERDRAWEQKLSEKDEELEERAAELLEERESARELAKVARTLITGSGLPKGWQTDLLRRWDVLPSGPTAALAAIEPVTEADGTEKDVVAVLKEAVGRDLQHAADLLAESNGGRRPRIHGLGGGDSGEQPQAPPRNSAFRDFLRESGDKFGEKPEEYEAGLTEMVREGVRD